MIASQGGLNCKPLQLRDQQGWQIDFAEGHALEIYLSIDVHIKFHRAPTFIAGNYGEPLVDNQYPPCNSRRISRDVSQSNILDNTAAKARNLQCKIS